MIGRKRLTKPVVLLFSCCMIVLLGLILSVSAISARAAGKGGGGGNRGGGNGNDNNAGGNQVGGGAQNGNGGVGGGGINSSVNKGGGGGNGGADVGGGNGGGGNGGGGGKVGGGGGGNNAGERKIGSLKTVSIPGPTAAELNDVIKNKAAAIALGKAFFWDMQFGSDGVTACATCHFTAGTDNRIVNQTNPGFRRVDGNGNPSPDSNTFHSGFGPDYQLSLSDFPLHKLSNSGNSSSGVLSDNNNIVGSQGVYRYDFVDVVMGQALENESWAYDNVFDVSTGPTTSVNVRRVTPRNAPPVINAVFNARNFWDGRAQSVFNGVNPFGLGDPNTGLLQVDSAHPGSVKGVLFRLSNSSLASQAVGPPGSDVEMSAAGRSFRKMGKKMLSLVPLSKQLVAGDDSVLGPLSAQPGNGLKATYVDMVKAAFQSKWWDSDVVVDGNGNYVHNGTPQNTNEFSIMENNFSMFWGVAIQMYESTLVSDSSRFDQYMEGNRNALTALEQLGMDRFTGKGHCSSCHSGPEFTDAAVANIKSRGVVEQLLDGRWHDTGFHNIGVRPSTDDMGIAAGDPSGLSSLSVAGMASQGLVSGTPVTQGAPVSSRGAVKTPGLRNIDLTGPYFVNGGQATLSQVLDFYSRGGDFPSADVDPNLEKISFSPTEKTAVVAFLRALTDERVRKQSAPFDHPSLVIPNGMTMVNGSMVEQTISIPATGANGGAALPRFCEALAGGSSQGCN
jgi:cytochrome c peroxidase